MDRKLVFLYSERGLNLEFCAARLAVPYAHAVDRARELKIKKGRARGRHNGRQQPPWTPEIDADIADMYDRQMLTAADIAVRLGRSRVSVTTRVRQLREAGKIKTLHPRGHAYGQAGS
jgi:biotin operon repressor